MARITSIEVYNQIKDEGLLSERRLEIYKIVYNNGPMTATEAHVKCGLANIKGYRNNANARLLELRELGVVKERGTGICSQTGRKVIRWETTDKLPYKLTPLQKLKRQLKQAEAKVRKIKKKIAMHQYRKEHKGQLDLFDDEY